MGISMKLRRLGLKLEIGIGFGCLLVIMALLGLLGCRSAMVNETQMQALNAVMRAEQQVCNVQAATMAMENGMRSLLMTSNNSEVAGMSSSGPGSEEVSTQMDLLQPLLVSTEAKAQFDKLQQDVAADAMLNTQVMGILQGSDGKTAAALEAATGLYDAPGAVETRGEIMKDSSTLANVLAQMHKDAMQQQVAQNAHARLRLLLLTLLGVAVSMAVAVFISRSILHAVQQMLTNIEGITSNNLAGDDVAVECDDDLGRTARSINKMKNNLREMILGIAATAENVSESSREISLTASHSASSAENQKHQVQQIAAAMMEMAATVRMVSEHSNNAVISTTSAAESARNGGVIVDDVLERMRGISESVRESAANIEHLGAKSDEIGRIVGVIDEIATQTNLLALNAAIEAARAGEQGRGFAVVAGEVRRLAERTSTATNEIASVIKNVQRMTAEAVQQMRFGMTAVEQGVEVTGKAGDSIQRIIQESEKVGNMVAQIACAATQQSSTTEQVNASMGQISKLAAESADGAQQSAHSCEQLFKQVVSLKEMVERFRVGRVGGVKQAAASRPMAA